MKIFFDTSVLIAGLVSSHSKHKLALNWLYKANLKGNEMLISTHTLAECYAVLTKLPLSPRISPSIAKIMLQENIVDRAKFITLTTKEYWDLLQEISCLDLAGGIIYDAIIFWAARKASADKLLTFNAKHFSLFPQPAPDFIEVPR